MNPFVEKTRTQNVRITLQEVEEMISKRAKEAGFTLVKLTQIPKRDRFEDITGEIDYFEAVVERANES